MSSALIAVGGNQPESESAIRSAIHALDAEDTRVTACSKLHRSPAMGRHAGADFLNGAIAVETALGPNELLARLHEIESAQGRHRTIHWGPRTIDLDLLMFDDRVICKPALVVPHPAMWYRGFVLKPLAEIAGSMVHPIVGLTIGELADRISRCPIVLEVAGSSADQDLQCIIQRVTAVMMNQFGDEAFRIVPAAGKVTSSRAFAQLRIESPPVPQRPGRQPFHAEPFVIGIHGDSNEHRGDSHDDFDQQLIDLGTAILS